MAVTGVEKDLDARTLTVTSRFDAPVEAVWQVWADPRLLERWWGPPVYPATVLDHDLRTGGRGTYLMTGPEGDKHYGWWEFTEVEAPHRIAYTDGFGNADGTVDESLPTTDAVVTLTADGTGTVMVIRTVFPSTEAMRQVLAMGLEEGLTQSLGQIDALL